MNIFIFLTSKFKFVFIKLFLLNLATLLLFCVSIILLFPSFISKLLNLNILFILIVSILLLLISFFLFSILFLSSEILLIISIINYL